MIITSSGPLAKISGISKILLVINDSLFLLVVLIIPSNFVYRYIQLCKNNLFEFKHGIAIVFLVIIGWGIYVSSIIAVMTRGKEYENEFEQFITSNLPLNLHKITFFGGYMHNVDLQLCVISAVIQIILSYLIISYCIFGIITYLRKNQSQFSLGKLRIQNQVTKALLGQVRLFKIN
uniref:ABC transmembrane type-1 domain-containing protein n=1 Tax=Panagrolaimus superbus TaxID=310955 RepID=A0A914Y397_9BILA